MARNMVRVAADIGVDYVKFQSWQTGSLSRGAHDPQFDWFRQAELSDQAHFELIEECDKRGVTFLTTCFDRERADFLARLGLREIKVGSPDAASHGMLTTLKQHFDHVIISTGMAMEHEIRATADLMNGSGFTLMHCVSLYPTPIDRVNLRRMDWLRRFNASVGYSDHCIGTHAVKLAIARGASYVEKHFSLGEAADCRVSPWDADPGQLEDIVRFAEDCDTMSGTGDPDPEYEELQARHRYIGRWGDNR